MMVKCHPTSGLAGPRVFFVCSARIRINIPHSCSSPKPVHQPLTRSQPQVCGLEKDTSTSLRVDYVFEGHNKQSTLPPVADS